MKAIVAGVLITIDASPMKIHGVDKSLIHADHDEQDEELWGFHDEVVAMIEQDEKTPLDFDPYSNILVNALLKKQGHFPRMTLGRKKKASPQMGLRKPCKQDTFGVGYTPTPEEIAKVKSQI